jgi:polyketide biosynthesis enoyl-CoA hydratase PksI
MSLVTLERDGDGIATLALADGEHKNALRGPFIDELCARLEELKGDERIKVCVLRGLPEVFCAGAAESLLLELAEGAMAASDIVLSKLLLDLPVPTIAAMEGHAVGGGLALGLCCDVVLMARESRYGCSFMNMGFTPGMATTALLGSVVGEYLAAEMMFGGQLFKGAHFAERSGVNYVLPRAEVWERALEVARRIAEKPRFALVLLKRSLSLRRRQAFEESRGVEAMMHELCFARPETAARIRESYPSLSPAKPGGAQER